MWQSNTHAAQTLVPSVLSMTALHTERSASTCCGTRCRMQPISSSPRANSRIELRNECCATRVGSACGSSRAVEVTMNMRSQLTSRWLLSSSTNEAVSTAIVAVGSSERMPCASKQTRRAAPSAMATEVDCDAHAAERSPRLFRVVCCPPPHVFLGLCTSDTRTELLRMPLAASCVASSGSTDW